MSYDLMVFDPSVASLSRGQFLQWYGHQIKWEEDHDYNDPTVATPKLQSWFRDIIQSFPALPQEDLPKDEDSVTDYSIGQTVIYCSFRWSKAEQAYNTVFKLAQKHGVGFFDVSSNDPQLWLPNDGKLRIAHSAPCIESRQLFLLMAFNSIQKRLLRA